MREDWHDIYDDPPREINVVGIVLATLLALVLLAALIGGVVGFARIVGVW